MTIRTSSNREAPFSAQFLAVYADPVAIGEGGMAQVFRARHVTLDRPVAIKVLVSLDADQRRRFDREARVLASLTHPNIVRVFETGLDGELAYLAMELVEGETVESRQLRSRLSVPEALGICEQVARALEYAHAQGRVHRDVKPANVFLTADGIAKLGDFGLARPLEHGATVTRPDVVIGTPEFIAPEQVRGEELCPGSDQFSLGVMLYWLVAGCFPYDGERPAEMLAARIEGPAHPLTDRAPQAPAELGRLLARMLEARPDRRFASMTDVRERLAALIPGGVAPVTAPLDRPAAPSGRTAVPGRTARASGATLVSKHTPPVALPRASAAPRVLTAAVVGALLVAAVGLIRSTPSRPRSPVAPATTSPPARAEPDWPLRSRRFPSRPALTGAIRPHRELFAALDRDGPAATAAMAELRKRTGLNLGTSREIWRGWFELDDWLEGKAASPPHLPTQSSSGPLPPIEEQVLLDQMHHAPGDTPVRASVIAISVPLRYPDDPRVLLFLGWLLELERRTEAARRVYHHALAQQIPCSSRDLPQWISDGLVSALIESKTLEARCAKLLACGHHQSALWVSLADAFTGNSNERLVALAETARRTPGQQIAAASQLAHYYEFQTYEGLKAEETLRQGLADASNDPHQRFAFYEGLHHLLIMYIERGQVAEARALAQALPRDSNFIGLFEIIADPIVPATAPRAADHSLVVSRQWEWRLAESGKAQQALIAYMHNERNIDPGFGLAMAIALWRNGVDADWATRAVSDTISPSPDSWAAWSELAGCLGREKKPGPASRLIDQYVKDDPTNPWPVLTYAMAASRQHDDKRAADLLARALANPRAVGELYGPCVMEVAFRPAWVAFAAGDKDRARNLAMEAAATLPPKMRRTWGSFETAYVAPLSVGDLAQAAQGAEQQFLAYPPNVIFPLTMAWWAAPQPDPKLFEAVRERVTLCWRLEAHHAWALDELETLAKARRRN